MRHCKRLSTAMLAAVAVAGVGALPTAAVELLVTSPGTHTVQRYHGQTGAFIGTLIPPNSGGLQGPAGLAFAPDGNLYVSSSDGNQILRYDGRTGAFLGSFASGPELEGPMALVFGPDGNLYVTSAANGRILRYDGQTGASLGDFAAGGALGSPIGLAFAPDGNLYVSSSGGNQILRYDGRTGAFLDVFVPAGLGGLDAPADLVFGPDADLYVSSSGGNQILRYDGRTGAFLGSFALGGDLQRPTGLSFGPDRNLYVSSSGSDIVLRYDGQTGVLLGTFASAGLESPQFLVFSPLEAPSGLTANAVSSSRVDLSWERNSDGESGYEIERQTGHDPFRRIALLGADVARFTDTDLEPGTNYTYRVRAVLGSLASTYAHPATATIAGGGRLQVSETLTLPRTPLGSMAVGSLTLRNVGSGPLTGNVGTVPAPFWVLSGRGPFILAPGQSMAVSIGFAPLEPGGARRRLWINSDDTAQAATPVMVFGTGTGVVQAPLPSVASYTARVDPKAGELTIRLDEGTPPQSSTQGSARTGAVVVGASHRFSLTGSVSAPVDGILRGTVTLTADSPHDLQNVRVVVLSISSPDVFVNNATGTQRVAGLPRPYWDYGNLTPTSRQATRTWEFLNPTGTDFTFRMAVCANTGWYVAPDGGPTGEGTVQSPWDITTGLQGGPKKTSVQPGDTVQLRGGTYKKPFANLGKGFQVRLAGIDGAPIHVRPVKGERVTIDGGLDIQRPSTYLWIWDLEILVSEPRPAEPWDPKLGYGPLQRPWGGLNVYTGTGCKFINLVIHDNCQGVSWQSPTSIDSELYGCLIYDNGWRGTDRGHGHAIYTQNEVGVKTIADCILTGGYGYSMHAYGEKAYVNNYLVEGNICYKAGSFLIGGKKPSCGIRVFRNRLYGINMQIGYSAPFNVDCNLRENTLLNGSIKVTRYQKVVEAGNQIVGNTGVRPRGARAILRPNRYDPNRATLAIFNWDRKATVPLDPKGFLKAGDQFRLMDPRDFFGAPVLTGTYDGNPIPVRISGEFAAFVLLKEPR